MFKFEWKPAQPIGPIGDHPLWPCPLLVVSNFVRHSYIFWLVVWNIFYFSIYWELHHSIYVYVYPLNIQKGTPPGPTNHMLIFSYFLFILAVINEFYWKDMSMCIHFIKYTYLFHFPWRIYTSMCFSDATPGGVEGKKKLAWPPPLLPVRRKCAGCGQWGLDRCQCQWY